MRVAILGAGPKGLFAAERLLAHLDAARAGSEGGAAAGFEGEDGSAVRVDVWDPRPPGWGAAYDPGQPACWRLNVSSAIVDAGWHAGPAPSPAWLVPLDAWRAASGEAAPLEPFPARGVVGRYLADVWARLVASSTGGVELRHVPRAAGTVTASEGASTGSASVVARPGWRPTSPGGWMVDGEFYDEVLLATGHADDWSGALRHGWTGPQALVPGVFGGGRLGDGATPDDGTLLGEAAVPPGARVGLRGAALTFIDAALALTEGRGGAFVARESGQPPRYRASGREPAVLWPTARGGRFGEVKPQPGGPLAQLDLDAPRDRGLAAIRSCGSANAALTTVADTARAYLAVADTARAYLAAAGAGPDGVEELVHGPAAPAPDDPADALLRSWQLALGWRRPGAAWAVGQAWRDLYPALVDRFAWRPGPHAAGVPERAAVGGVPDAASPDDFTTLAAAADRLERVAFGPPPVNAGKLFALLDAGLVDASSLAGATVDASGFRWRDSGRTPPDVVVDAVLPPPGVASGVATLPGRLVDAGLAAVAPGRRGLALDLDATVLAPDGTRREGLACVGRPSEDTVIGNDTLSRVLHGATERWAARVAARIRRCPSGAHP